MFEVLLSGFDKAGFEEGSVGAALFHGAHAAGGDFYVDGFVKFRHKKLLFLKIGVFADLAGRVEFSGTGPVAVAAAHDRALIGYGAYFFHRFFMLS